HGAGVARVRLPEMPRTGIALPGDSLRTAGTVAHCVQGEAPKRRLGHGFLLPGPTRRGTQGRREAAAHSRGPALDLPEVEQDVRRLANQLQRPGPQGRAQTHGPLTLFALGVFSVLSVSLWLVQRANSAARKAWASSHKSTARPKSTGRA